MIVVDLLLVLLAIVGVLVGLVLLVPIAYRVAGDIDDEGGSWHARIAWGFGFVTLRADGEGLSLRLLGLRLVRSRWGEGAKKERRRKPRPEKERDAGGGRGVLWFMARRRLLMAIAGRYLRALHLSGRVEGIVGLAEPDQTAALYQLLVLADRALPEGTVDVQVDWVEEVVELEGRFGGWLWPLQLVGITLWLFVNRKTWRALRAPVQS